MRQQCSKHQAARLVLYQQGRQVFYIFVAKQLWIFFNIHPYKGVLGQFTGQRIEVRPVFCARVTPCGAVTDDGQAVMPAQSGGQGRYIMLGFEYLHKRQMGPGLTMIVVSLIQGCIYDRSEERRVGKEGSTCRSRGGTE